MPVPRRDRISQLEERRQIFGPGEAGRVVKLLDLLTAARINDPDALMRFHETLVFLRAFPHGPGVVRKTEELLNHFGNESRSCASRESI